MANKLKGYAKKTAKTVLSVGLMIVTIVGVFGYIIPICKDAKSFGISTGDKSGKMVGNVIGSYDGVTKGIAEGSGDGKEEGLVAKDTNPKIKNSISEVGNLEVLEAGVKLENVNTLGDDYAALFFLKGVAVFSVNLNEAEINDKDDLTIEILLPEVNVEIYIDERETEKLAEYQKHSWSGSAKDGFVEYMNTRDAVDNSAWDMMENYDALIEVAENSAKKQVEIIAKAAVGNTKDVIVNFKKEVQGDK